MSMSEVNGYPYLNPKLNPQPKPKRRRGRRVLWSAAAALFAAGLICCAISIYVGYQLTHSDKKPVDETPAAYGMSYTEQDFISRDGKDTLLKGWVIEPETKPVMTVIMSHGYRGNRLERNVPFLPLAKSYRDAGYRVVLFDFRYSGESGGSMITIGAKEKLDLLGVIGTVKERYSSEPIALYGISMGASTSLLAAGLTEDVIAVVADSPFSNLRSYLADNLSVWSHLPNFPFTPLTLALMPRLTDLDPAEAIPMDALDRIYPRPVYFIHGTGDTFIPNSESVKMADTHPDRFTIWRPEGMQHVGTYKHMTETYVKNVMDFFEKARTEAASPLAAD